MQRARRLDGTPVAATLAPAVRGLPGCGGGGDEVTLPPPPRGELAELRGLRAGELTFAARPRTCAHTRAVVIGVARGPKPTELQLGEGGCFVFENRASDAPAFLRPIGRVDPSRGADCRTSVPATCSPVKRRSSTGPSM